MRAYMIAVLKNGDFTCGYRIYDSESGKVNDVSEDKVKRLLKSDKDSIQNIGLNGDSIIGTSGVLKRYTAIDLKTDSYSKKPLIILNVIKSNNKILGYRVCSCMGKASNLNVKDTIKAARLHGIANGKLMSTEKLSYITPIIGEYTVMNSKNNNSEKAKTTKIKLYHVSFYDLGETAEFTPRVPDNGAGLEDKTIPRICLSDKIERCIAAIPDGVDCVGEDEIFVYSCEFDIKDIKDRTIITYKQLYDKGLVPDAMVTHEYWCTKRITMKRTKIVVTAFEDDYTYVADEADRRNIYNAACEYCELDEDYMDKYNNVSCFELMNKLIYNDEKLMDSFNEIAEKADLTSILTLNGFEYDVVD